VAYDSKLRPLMLAAQVQELKQAARRTEESLAVLAHELRNPLASMANAMAVLRKRRIPEGGQDELHALIGRQLRQMARLVSALYERSSSSLGGVQLQQQSIDLRQVIKDSIEDIQPELIRRGQSLAVTQPERSIWLLADADRLEQVFINILSNASKYSDAGGKISLFIDATETYVVVRIRDTGIGIAADSLPHIFNPFVRVNSADVRTRPGLGIGLALVREIVDAHGGSVSVHSEGIGLGSEFVVRLKL
jgi:signal transduction histidine kinase